MTRGSSEHDWQLPERLPELGPEQVHVWRAALPEKHDFEHKTVALLSVGELERAQRFHFSRHRQRFVFFHAALRVILGRYLGLPPARVPIAKEPFGKPQICKASNPRDLRFNMSHSHEMAVYAFAWGRAVGIDVERPRAHSDTQGIARRFFSRAEAETVNALAEPDRGAAFFNCWTRKEAYIKGRGDGLRYPLDCFEVSLRPGEPAALLANHRHPEELSRWCLRAFSPGQDYVGALAVEGSGLSVAFCQWVPELLP